MDSKVQTDGFQPSPIPTLQSLSAAWDVRDPGHGRWLFDCGNDVQITFSGNLSQGRTLVVLFDGADSRALVEGILSSGLVVSGEKVPAPYLIFEGLMELHEAASQAADTEARAGSIFGIVSHAMDSCGADRVLLIGVGRGDCMALQIGRRFVDSMVLIMNPTACAFDLVNSGEKPAAGSATRNTFVFYVQGISDGQSVSEHYLD